MSDLPDLEKIRPPERENCELRQANEILLKASHILRKGNSTAGSGHDAFH